MGLEFLARELGALCRAPFLLLQTCVYEIIWGRRLVLYRNKLRSDLRGALAVSLGALGLGLFAAFTGERGLVRTLARLQVDA